MAGMSVAKKVVRIREALAGELIEPTTAPRLAITPESDVRNRVAVRSLQRSSSPSADEQTPDAQHAEQPDQSAAPTLPCVDIFYPQQSDAPAQKIAPGSDSAIPSPAQPAPAKHPQKAVRLYIGVLRETRPDPWPSATVDTFLRAENSGPAFPPHSRHVRAPPRDTAWREYELETVSPEQLDPYWFWQTATPRTKTDRCDARSKPAASSTRALRPAETRPTESATP